MYTSSVHSYHYVHIFVLNLYNIIHAKYCTFYKALCKPLVLTACAKGSGAAIWHLYASNLYSNPLVPDFHACLHSTCTMFMLDNDIYFLVLLGTLVAGAWTERQKMFHGGSFLKLADDNMDIQNPEAQNRELSGF